MPHGVEVGSSASPRSRVRFPCGSMRRRKRESTSGISRGGNRRSTTTAISGNSVRSTSTPVGMKPTGSAKHHRVRSAGWCDRSFDCAKHVSPWSASFAPLRRCRRRAAYVSATRLTALGNSCWASIMMRRVPLPRRESRAHPLFRRDRTERRQRRARRLLHWLRPPPVLPLGEQRLELGHHLLGKQLRIVLGQLLRHVAVL